MIRLKRLRDGRFLIAVHLGEKILRFRQGNYSQRRVIPFVERSPFGCCVLRAPLTPPSPARLRIRRFSPRLPASSYQTASTPPRQPAPASERIPES